jgi:ribosomal protein S27E
MNVEDLFERSHLLLNDRRCRSCGEVKNLIDGFYLIRKNRENISSSYSYECKDCTKKRVVISRMTNRVFDRWEYPDW